MNGRMTALVFASFAIVGIGCGSSKLGGDDGTGGSGGAGGSSPVGATGGTNSTGGGAPDGGGDTVSRDELAAAQAAWAAAKPNCRSYRYQSRQTSVFGFCETTTVEIANDQPISRSFESDDHFCAASADAGATEQWSEVGASQVGQHADGDRPLTVEQLFAACQQILASDPATHQLFFGADSNGVPARCSATLIGCVDDCTTSVDIASFACEATEDGGGGNAGNGDGGSAI